MTYKERNTFAGKIVYFSHPVFTHRTKTERTCLKILKGLNPQELINPANFGLKHNIQEYVERADTIVAMAVSGKFTYLVWKELEFGKKNGASIYTFMVESKNDIGPLVQGVPDEIVRLSKEESQEFVDKMINDDLRESIISLFIGNIGRRF